jgi:hypothetical protein
MTIRQLWISGAKVKRPHPGRQLDELKQVGLSKRDALVYQTGWSPFQQEKGLRGRKDAKGGDF